MLQLTPQSRIFLALAPVDFRKGIDGLTAVCRQALEENPLGGAVTVFRNRAGTALKLLLYAGQVASLYADRWTIETAFHHLTVALHCEVDTLGYPKAALFGFCMALVAYNVVALVKGGRRTARSTSTSSSRCIT